MKAVIGTLISVVGAHIKAYHLPEGFVHHEYVDLFRDVEIVEEEMNHYDC